MRRLRPTDQIRRFLGTQEGATAIEYAIIAAGVAGAIIVAVAALGGSLTTMWTAVANAFN